jgi:hypothetical protein
MISHIATHTPSPDHRLPNAERSALHETVQISEGSEPE